MRSFVGVAGVLSSALLAGVLMFVISAGRADNASVPAGSAPPSALVRVSPVRQLPRRDTLVAYGRVEFSPEDAEVVALEAERVVTGVYVAAGQAVRKGDRLVTVQATPNAQLELERARIDVTFARQEVERLRSLRVRQLATNAQVQAAEAQLARAEAILASVMKRRGGPEDVTISASLDGVVQTVNVRQGDVVAPHTPLVRLARGNRLQVRLGVEPADLERIRVGQTVEVTPVQGGTAPVTAATAQVYRQVDPKTRLAEVVVPLPAAPELLPGALVRGVIVLRTRAAVLVVPRSAVLFRGPRPYVFVVEKNRASLRWVEAGADDGRNVEVIKGLAIGESVVTVGNYELKDGMAVRVEPGGP